jgi:hypothetical protein
MPAEIRLICLVGVETDLEPFFEGLPVCIYGMNNYTS